jgi:hypothetical protein
MHRFVTHQRPSSALPQAPRMDFYREEFVKHQRCLQRQREYYSEGAYTSAEQALARLLSRLDQLCRSNDADRLMGRLLRQFDVVTNLSGWSDPKKAN